MKFIILILVVLLLTVCSTQNTECPETLEECPDIKTTDLDLQKFTGKWFEVGISPFARYVLQPLCHCVAADHTSTSEPNLLKLVGRCNLIKRDGKVISLGGSLLQPFKKQKGKLLMNFDMFPGIYASYWVLDTDYDNYAVVWSCFRIGTSTKKEAWILSRKAIINDEEYEKIINKVKSKMKDAGFDVSTLIKLDNAGCKFEDEKK